MHKEHIKRIIRYYWLSKYPAIRQAYVNYLEQGFRYNHETVIMNGSYYINKEGGGWYHAE